MSALPPKADIHHSDGHVRHVPKADICRQLARHGSTGPTHLHHPISRNERGRDSLSRMRFDPLTHVAHDGRQGVFSVPFRPNTANKVQQRMEVFTLIYKQGQ